MLSDYFSLASAGLKYSLRRDLAYFAGFMIQNFINIAHVAAFTVFYLVLFQNTESIAGYNKDQVLVFYLVSQSTFYLYMGLFDKVRRILSTSINKGVLDYLLLRPRNPIAVLAAQNVAILELVRGAILVAAISLLVDWSNVEIVPSAVPFGIVIVLAGTFLLGLMHVILSSIAFWTGQSEQLVLFTANLGSQLIPYDAASFLVRALIFYVFPVMVKSGLAVAVMTGRVPVARGMLIVVGLLLVFGMLARTMWRAGLRQYTSASS